MTAETKPVLKQKRKTPKLQFGEQLNPDNLRYIDNQGMVNEEGGNGYWSSEVKAFMSALTLKGLFHTEDWVFICCDSIAAPLSSCPLSVFQVERSDDGKNKKTKVEQHPVTKMFEKPNEFQSPQELNYSLAVDVVLGGNGFLFHSPAQKIYNMPFERVQYNPGPNGVPRSLFYYPQYEEDILFEETKKEIALDQVIHAKRPNPSSAIWGLSPFTPGRKSVLFNRYSSDYLLSFYLKGATPQMILEVENATNQKNLVRMLRSFEAAYTGRRNQRRTLILPKGVKATQSDTKIVDQQLIELVKQNRETILNILRVPKHALGLQEAGSLGSREHELALRWFWKQTIIPTMGFIEGSLTKHFRERRQITEQQVVGFDTSEVQYVSEDLLQLAELSEKLAGTWTVNERRDRIFSLPALADGDIIATLPKAPALPSFMSQPAQEKQKQTTLEIAEPKDPEQHKEKKGSQFLSRILSKYESQIRAGDESLKKQATEQVPKLNARTVKLFADQTEIMVKEFQKQAKSDGLRADGKISAKQFKENMNEALVELEEGYLDDYNKLLFSTMDAGYGAQVGMVFDPKAQEALAAYQAKDVEGQRNVLKARGIDIFKSVTGTSTDRVTALVEKGLKDGSTVSQVSDSIVKYMKEQARWRADTIARTETLTAFSIGGMATLERANSAIPGLKKMWVTANDEDVRLSHQGLMGQVVKADGKFSNGLRFPRDPLSRNASEIINCRCVSLMLPPEDVADYEQEIADLPKKAVTI